MMAQETDYCRHPSKARLPPFDQSVDHRCNYCGRTAYVPRGKISSSPSLPTDQTTIPGRPLNAIGLTSTWLEQELKPTKLNNIHSSLWWAGRPGNVRPLHRQRMMHREIIVTEDIGLHLVWYERTIYIKPLPEYLLCWTFFQDEICTSPSLAAAATGFLLVYTRLVAQRSDFRIAVALGLMPESLQWEQWYAFASSLLMHVQVEDSPINKRYQYGELRLARLNHISLLSSHSRRLYYSTYSQYNHFFMENFGWCLFAVGFFTVILEAMQVMLSTQSPPTAFQSMAFDFGTISICFVVGAIGAAAGLFFTLFIYFMVTTLRIRIVDDKSGVRGDCETSFRRSHL